MTTKSGLCARTRRRRPSLAIVTVLLFSLTLAACGDKEVAAPSRLAEISRAKEAAELEKSQRLLAEARLGTVLWLAFMGAGGALVLGVAIGSSSRRETEGAQPEGPETDI